MSARHLKENINFFEPNNSPANVFAIPLDERSTPSLMDNKSF